jgi:adenylosuccinate lyase
MKGMDKVILNEEKLRHDLQDNWVIISEAIQTILRRENYPNPYEALKALTRTNKKIDKKILHAFIDKLKVSEKIKTELKSITPENYTGIDII